MRHRAWQRPASPLAFAFIETSGSGEALIRAKSAFASAGNRTRINCLEGSYADHYTTDANPARIHPRQRHNPVEAGTTLPPFQGQGAKASPKVPCQTHSGLTRPQSHSFRPRGLMEKASDFGSEDCRFESCRGRLFFSRLFFSFLFVPRFT